MAIGVKKALFIISSLGGGGAEGVCVNIANGLAENGWQIDLVVLHLNDVAYLDRVSNKLKIHVLGVPRIRYAAIPLTKLLFKVAPQKILVFDFDLTVILTFIRTIFRFNTRIVYRNINTLSKFREKKYGIFQRFFINPLIDYFFLKVDYVINQCNEMRKDLINLYPELKDKNCTIYNPISKHIEAYSSFNELQLSKKQNYLLCVGRLEKQKAFHYAIRGFATISTEFPDLRLKIIGKGSLENELKQLAFRLGVIDRVDFEGFQKNMIPYYVNARATVLTSLYEGFPNVLVESIALNTPVVAFDCKSGPSEIIQNNINGYLVQTENLNDLEMKLRLILNSNSSWKNLRDSIKQCYIEEVLKQYENKLA